VHEDPWDTRPRGPPPPCPGLLARGHVVDHGRTCGQRTLGDHGSISVDTDPDAVGDQRLDDRDDSPFLFGGVDPVGTWAGRLAADVDQIGAVVSQAAAMRDGIVETGETAAVRERIRGDVEDADDDQAIRPGRAGPLRAYRPSTSDSASARVRESLWKMPRTAEVTVSEPACVPPAWPYTDAPPELRR
jgi:hypothetical protein